MVTEKNIFKEPWLYKSKDLQASPSSGCGWCQTKTSLGFRCVFFSLGNFSAVTSILASSSPHPKESQQSCEHTGTFVLHLSHHFWSVWVLNKVQESVLRYSDGYWWIIGNRPCLLYIFHWPRLVWQALYQLSSLQASPKPSSLKFCWFFFSNFFWVSFICSCFSFFYFTEFCSYIFFCLLWAYFSLSGFLKVENWFVIAFLFWYTHIVLYTFLQSLLSFVIHFDIMYSYLCSGKNVLQFPSVLIIWPCCLVSKSDL